MTAKARSKLAPSRPRTDMCGSWIWVPSDAGYEWRNSYACFRKSFNAAGDVTIDIAADTHYDLFMDGRRIDRGGAPADAAYKTFDTHTATLEPGEHAIAVLVHHIGQSCATAMQSRPGLFLEMTTQAGLKIVTDSSWRVLPASAFEQDLPCMMSHFGFYEICDFRKMPEGWTDISFDDSNWYNAEVVGQVGCPPWRRMIPRDIPLLTTTRLSVTNVACYGTYTPGVLSAAEEHITVAVEMAGRRRQKNNAQPNEFPVTLAQGKEDEFVVMDFGREVTGHVKLGCCGAQDGQQVDIGYDETLDEQGLPNPRRTYVHFADRFYLRQDQHEIEVFGARGFRYLLIDIPAGKGGLILTKVQVDERTYPVTRMGTFECSDETLAELYQTGINTTRLCMLDTYVDCPSRERVMWMDSYIEALCSSYGMGVTNLWRRTLYLYAQNVCKKGVLSGAVKGFAPCDSDPLILSYVMYYVCSVSDYLWHSGDRDTCISLFDTVMKQFEVIGQFTSKEGLLNDDWPNTWGTFLDWSAMDYGGVSASNNAIYIKMHRKAARLAEELQKHTVARALRETADRLVDAFRQTFWAEEEGLFVDAVYDGKASEVRSQLTNILAIWADVVEADKARSIVERITDKKVLLPRTKGDYRLRSDFKCQTGGIVQIGTPALGFLMAYVMFKLNMDQAALDYLKDNWTPIMRNGTFAEHFVQDDNTSFCHGWSAGPVILLPQFILGVKPVSPGWKEIEVIPHPGNLKWAKGTIPTPRGDIQVSWEHVAGKLQVSVEAPDGITVANRLQ